MNWTIVYIVLLVINITGIFHPKNKRKDISIGATALMILGGILIWTLK